MSFDLSTKGCASATLVTSAQESETGYSAKYRFIKPQYSPKENPNAFINEIMQFVYSELEWNQPDAVIIEDVFANKNNLDAVKPLIKIQGIVELALYKYQKAFNKKDMLIEYRNAASIRAYFGFNIEKILSPSQFAKKQEEINKKAKKKKKDGTDAKRHKLDGMTYEQYINNPNNYINKYPYVDFKKYKEIKPSITEYDYAKKILIINHVNDKFGTNFMYKDNDIADAYLNVLFLYLKLKEDNPGIFSVI